jgi:hypothetical protein
MLQRTAGLPLLWSSQSKPEPLIALTEDFSIQFHGVLALKVANPPHTSSLKLQPAPKRKTKSSSEQFLIISRLIHYPFRQFHFPLILQFSSRLGPLLPINPSSPLPVMLQLIFSLSSNPRNISNNSQSQHSVNHSKNFSLSTPKFVTASNLPSRAPASHPQARTESDENSFNLFAPRPTFVASNLHVFARFRRKKANFAVQIKWRRRQKKRRKS